MEESLDRNILICKAKIIIFMFSLVLSGAIIGASVVLGHWVWVFVGLVFAAVSVWRIQVNVDLIIHDIEFVAHMKLIEKQVTEKMMDLYKKKEGGA